MVAVATVSSMLDVLTDFTGGSDEGVGRAGPARLHGRDRDRAAGGRHRGHRRTRRRRRSDDIGRHRGDGHVQQRRAAARAQGARRNAGAARAEEIDSLFQRRHGAQRRRQPGRVALRDQRRRPRARGHLSRRHARPAGGRPRRQTRSQASGRGSALFSGRGVSQQFSRLSGLAGHARVAGLRHRRQGVHGLERFRRRVRARAARHVRLLPARLQQRQRRRRTAASAVSACA